MRLDIEHAWGPAPRLDVTHPAQAHAWRTRAAWELERRTSKLMFSWSCSKSAPDSVTADAHEPSLTLANAPGFAAVPRSIEPPGPETTPHLLLCPDPARADLARTLRYYVRRWHFATLRHALLHVLWLLYVRASTR